MSICPVSWLALERHALGELQEQERSAIEQHLSGCAACRQRQARILADQRPMPPLREPVRRRLWAPAALAAAVAAAVLLLLLRAPDEGPGIRAKGDDIALTLLRERDGQVAEDARSFAARDRFRVLLTCPPGHMVHDIVVVQGEERSSPLRIEAPLGCGSRQAVPGAFRLTGAQPADICAVDGAGQLRGCVSLRPEP